MTGPSSSPGLAAGNAVLGAALACARRGWPVFPCHPGRKTPATARGYLDATTDKEQITAWFAGYPGRNLAVATGLPGPDVLDVDRHPSGTGYPALARLLRAGLARGAAAWVRTPGGGAHGYYAGTGQRSGRLPAAHLDFRSAGGYVLVPPSRIAGRSYQLAASRPGQASLDWAHVTALLSPVQASRPPDRQGSDAGVTRLAAWVARLEEGNRNAGLFWAACRALDAGHPDGLDSLAAAARTAGLGDAEIRATLASARRTTRMRPPGARDAEAVN
jgi:hypothetical protein